ncbi:MAG: FHA domain-containing protein [Planctomycetota bacterium]|nr:FHA domain-containing protein [Planctomycetota bacterium]
MARLIVKTDAGTETIELRPTDAVGIGRDADNQIPLPDARGASRKHCRVAATPSGGGLAWELTDLGATNKTRVNGKPVDKVVLATGDVISVGTAEITFEDPDEEAHLKEAGSKGVCYLEWVKGDRKGEKIWLEATRVTLGRRPSNTIPLDDRMSSGHHAEITKDLNGYTIRDLGSTNGTLLNGEPTTEAALNHGSRIRIGNSLLVFKDPSMKDIEVELSQFDEDEGWGMMGDIDLSRARGSYAGLLIGLLIVGLAAAGGFFLMQEAEKDSGVQVAGGDGNLVENGDMEEEDALEFLWVATDDEAPVRVGATKKGKGFALRVQHTGGDDAPQPVLVSYTDEFPALSKEPLRVRAKVRASGDAALVLVWRNWRNPAEAEEAAAPTGPATRLTHTVPLGTGNVDIVAVKPVWAESMLLGVRLGKGGNASIDDVSVTREPEGGVQPVEIETPGNARAFVNGSGGMDVVTGLTVLGVGAAPVARLADGTVLTDFVADGAPQGSGSGPVSVAGHFRHGDEQVPASITWRRMENDEGLHADIACEQADAVGLAARLVRAHVGAGMNILTADGPRSIQAAPGEMLPGVRKTLSGNPNPEPGKPRTLFTFAVGGEATGNSLEIHAATDAALLDVRHLSKGTSASVDVITNYEVQRDAAAEALATAERTVRQQPGRGIELLREVAILYPFNERVRNRAQTLARSAEQEARTEIAAYRAALDAFRIFRSADTLAVLEEKGQAMTERFPSRGAGNGPLENGVAEIAAAAKDARTAWYTERAGNVLSRLERIADMLANVAGYEPMAAIYYRTIVERFGHLEGDDSFGRRVKRAREQYDVLRKDNAEAIPDRPR